MSYFTWNTFQMLINPSVIGYSRYKPSFSILLPLSLFKYNFSCSNLKRSDAGILLYFGQTSTNVISLMHEQFIVT